MTAQRRFCTSQHRGRTRARIHRGVLRAALGVGAAAASLVVLTAPAAAEREFVFQGHSVHASECQSDVKVDFHVTVRNGRLHVVSLFRVSQLNFPNVTPPIPFGRSRGQCFPGERSVMFLNYQQGVSAAIPFEAHHPNEFKDSDALLLGSRPIATEAWVLQGKVSIRRVHHRFRGTAHGDLAFAVSEGGLKFGGSSSGKVKWVATGHEQ